MKVCKEIQLDDGNLSIGEFCAWAGISRPYYYVLKKNGKGPREIHIGSKPLIPKPDARKWRDELPEVEVSG
ncbi:MAG: hypothetical protein WBO34_08195 [Gammaproteobacteria bacterium]